MKWKDERRSRNGGDNEMRVEPSKHELANLTCSFFRVLRCSATGDMALFNCHTNQRAGVAIEGHSSSHLVGFRSRDQGSIWDKRMAVVCGEVTWEQGLNR